MNSSLEKNSLSIAPGLPSTLAQHEREDLISNAKGTTGPIMVNPIRDTSIEETISEINNGTLGSSNLANYEAKMQQIRTNSLSRVRQNRRKPRLHNGHHQDSLYPRYTGNPNLHSSPYPTNFNHFIDHIYESIDNDSLASNGLYGRRNQINDLYAGSVIHDDEWSQNSSSSYGPLYDERPLLIVNESSSPSNTPLISGGHFQNHQINLCDKMRTNDLGVNHAKEGLRGPEARHLSSFLPIRSQNDFHREIQLPKQVNCTNMEHNMNWNDYSENPELPDLLQNPMDPTGANTMANIVGQAPVRGHLQSDPPANPVGVSSRSHHPKLSTYC